MSPERVFVGEEGEVIPCRWAENRKGAGTNRGTSGMRNLVCKAEDSHRDKAEQCP